MNHVFQGGTQKAVSKTSSLGHSYQSVHQVLRACLWKSRYSHLLCSAPPAHLTNMTFPGNCLEGKSIPTCKVRQWLTPFAFCWCCSFKSPLSFIPWSSVGTAIYRWVGHMDFSDAQKLQNAQFLFYQAGSFLPIPAVYSLAKEDIYS